MKLHDLKAQRDGIVREMRSIVDGPQDSGDLSAEQEERFDKLKQDLETVDKRIERRSYIDATDRAADAPDYTREERQFSLVRAIAGAAGIGGVDWGREREIGQELQRRSGVTPQGVLVPLSVFEVRDVISTTTPAAGDGSNIIGTDYRPGDYIDLLRSKLVVKRLGARVLSGLRGNVEIPRLQASASSGWVAENAALTASDMQFSSLTMSPKHCGSMVELSRNMLQQSSPDIEMLVRQDMAAILAKAVDKAAIEGGGANEPDGILATVGVSEVDISAGITWAKVLEYVEKVEAEDTTGTSFLTTPGVVKTMRSTVRETAVYYDTGSAAPVSADYIQTDPNSLAGYPLISSTLVPTGQLIFGNWPDLLIGYWSQLDILVNPFSETAYTKGNILIRSMMTMDVGIRHKESFVVADLGD
jgi:HK97 family phage major capsid protein